MTSEEIRGFVEQCMVAAVKQDQHSINTLPLWEIAYQLAELNKKQAENLAGPAPSGSEIPERGDGQRWCSTPGQHKFDLPVILCSICGYMVQAPITANTEPAQVPPHSAGSEPFGETGAETPKNSELWNKIHKGKP